MRTFVALLILAFALPVAAQEKKAEKKVQKKKMEKKEKTQAQPKQDWGRFSSNAKKDEAERARKAEKKL